MSGWDWLVLVGLAGVLIIGRLFDELRDLNEARTVRRYDMESHGRLMSEIRRHE